MHDWQLVDVTRTADLFTQKKYFCDPGVAGSTAPLPLYPCKNWAANFRSP